MLMLGVFHADASLSFTFSTVACVFSLFYHRGDGVLSYRSYRFLDNQNETMGCPICRNT